MLSEQLQRQIEQEAETITAKFNENNDYRAGIAYGYKEGYVTAGNVYAEKWQEAEQRAEEAREKITDLMDFVAEAKGQISDEEIISQVRKSLPGLLEALTSHSTGSTDKIAQAVINKLEYLEKLKDGTEL